VDDLCRHCPLTDFGLNEVNTGPHNLCEGSHCDVAKDNQEEEQDA